MSVNSDDFVIISIKSTYRFSHRDVNNNNYSDSYHHRSINHRNNY